MSESEINRRKIERIGKHLEEVDSRMEKLEASIGTMGTVTLQPVHGVLEPPPLSCDPINQATEVKKLIRAISRSRVSKRSKLLCLGEIRQYLGSTERKIEAETDG